MPRFSDIGLTPAVTDFRPSRKIAWANTVAVVVPSPARSDVLVATSFTIWAPMFSISSSSSISLATVTPSFVTVGLPNFLSMTTFRPLGPRVTFTASASWSTPRFKRARASTLNSRYLAAICYSSSRLAELRNDVGFLDQDDLFPFELHLRAAVLPVDHAVTDLQLHRNHFPLLPPSGADRDDLPLNRLLLSGVRDVQAALHRFGLLHRPDRHAVGQWKQLQLRFRCGRHESVPPPRKLCLSPY